ncbi:YbgA family protein [Pseudidiomarina sp. E22-M8]|uniref:YbgA family protein n=1 Tax=Pseudidiomarina sp. E22-M8 TaxID=3424768 RepID=UPI00403C518D
MQQIKVGISACLLGDEVRFDGGHKRSAFCTDELGRHVEFVKLCPEVGIGLPVPRPTIRLEEQHGEPRAVVAKTGEDVTARLIAFAERAQPHVSQVSGYVLCAKSPSCGMERVKLYNPENGHARKEGEGIFAAQLRQRYPALPLEEDGRLNDPQLRENFVMRVFVYATWQALPEPLSKADLLKFHTSLKLLLLAHDQQVYRSLGRDVAAVQTISTATRKKYIETVMAALASPATRANHTNVLQHIQGYFKQYLSASQREELTDSILSYHEGTEPLLVPLTLLRHYLREYPSDYLTGQRYLNPYPKDLKLRYGL